MLLPFEQTQKRFGVEAPYNVSGETELEQAGLSAHLRPLDWFGIATHSADRYTAWTRLEQVLANLGTDTAGFVYRMPYRLGEFPSDDEMYGCFVTPKWHEHYFTHRDLIKFDVFARHLFTSRRPKFVDSADFSTLPSETANAGEWKLFNLVTGFGMRQGLGMSFVDRKTQRISVVMMHKLNNGAGCLREVAENHLSEFHLAAQFFLEDCESAT